MLKKITSYDNIQDVREIFLGNNPGNSEKYKIIKTDKLFITILREGRFFVRRVLPIETIVKEDWYFETFEREGEIGRNPDSYLLDLRNKKEQNDI